jgi:hypothetical protein
LTAKNPSLEIRKYFIETYIWSMLLYGSEAWTITAAKKTGDVVLSKNVEDQVV